MGPGFRRDDDNSQPTMSSRRKPGPMARVICAADHLMALPEA